MTPTTTGPKPAGDAGTPALAWHASKAVRIGLGATALALVALVALEVASWSAPDLVERLAGVRGESFEIALAATRWGVTLLVVAGLVLWLRQTRASALLAQQRSERMEAALASLGIGVALYDSDERLVVCNEAFRGYFPEVRDLIVPGAEYIELLRAYYHRAPPEVRAGRSLDQFIGDVMRRRRGDTAMTEAVQHAGEGWLLMTECRLGDGGMVSLRVPLPSQHVTDFEVRQRRKAVDDVSDLTFDWFWRTDADGRFVEFSASMQRLFRYAPERLLGLRLSDLPGYGVEAEAERVLQDAWQAQRPFPWFRIQVLRGDSQPMWLAVSGKPLFNADGGFAGYYGAARDVGDREAMLAALRRADERFRALVDLATEWYWETDASLRVTLVKGPPRFSEPFERRVLGRTLDEAGRDFGLDWPALAQSLQRREAIRGAQYTIAAGKRGARRVYEGSAEPMFDNGEFRGYRGVSIDVTERAALIEQLREGEARLRALTELTSDWYWEMDEQLRYTRLQSGSGPRTPGIHLEEEEILGKHRWELPGELIRPATWEEHRATLRARRPFRDLLLRRRAADGTVGYLAVSGDPVFDAKGRFRGYHGASKDVTDQIFAQERVERLVAFDPLTQLANRHAFDDRARELLAQSFAAGRPCALLFIDLDNFRLLNNGYGHRVGDQMLAIVAQRMRDVIREPRLLGRRGGDELVALLVDMPRPEVAVESAQALIKAIAEPAQIYGMEVSVTPSIGIAFFPQDGADLDALLNAADAAMYQAKEGGRRTYAFYTPAVARRVDLRLRLEQRLRKAVESHDFRLFFQPLVSLADGKMAGAEALIRWNDAELGDVSPSEFVPIAEESGLVVGLGEWVLKDACRVRQTWRTMGLDVPPVSINMSGVQLRQIGCVEWLLDVLAQHEVQPSDIEVEVTETGLLDTSAVARENLIRLRNAGVKLALDDFGVGFSSLSHLRDLPIHRLKIDRSFTVECMRDARTLTIVKAVIEMARSLGISVTAEGIETQAQQTWMQHLGCDTAQGFLFSRPLASDEFLKLFLDKRGVARERSLMH